MTPIELPRYDDRGLNLVDPADSLGEKTAYISHVHKLSLERYVGRGDDRRALDVGCGYGRISTVLRDLGWATVGVDPSHRILGAAHAHAPGVDYVCGALPDLPFRERSFDLVLAQNLLRALHLAGLLDIARALPRMVAPGGRLVLVDNLRSGDPRYVEESWITQAYESAGLRLRRRVAIRAGRWWPIYAIRYGLVPRRWFDAIAARELRRLEGARRAPRWQYHNVLFEFDAAP